MSGLEMLLYLAGVILLTKLGIKELISVAKLCNELKTCLKSPLPSEGKSYFLENKTQHEDKKIDSGPEIAPNNP